MLVHLSSAAPSFATRVRSGPIFKTAGRPELSRHRMTTDMLPRGMKESKSTCQWVRKNAQDGGQLVKPWADLVSEPSSETPTDFIVDPGRRPSACAQC